MRWKWLLCLSWTSPASLKEAFTRNIQGSFTFIPCYSYIRDIISPLSTCFSSDLLESVAQKRLFCTMENKSRLVHPGKSFVSTVAIFLCIKQLMEEKGRKHAPRFLNSFMVQQYCSEDSTHDMSSIQGLGSQLEVDSTFHPSKIGKLSTQIAGGGQCVAWTIKL